MMLRTNFRFAPKMNVAEICRDWLSADGITDVMREGIAVDQLYQELKGAGIWQRMDRIYPIGNVGSTATVCIKTGNALVAVNSPAQVLNISSDSFGGGIQTNGSSSYLRSNITFNDASHQMANADGCVYILSDDSLTTSASRFWYGTQPTTTSRCNLSRTTLAVVDSTDTVIERQITLTGDMFTSAAGNRITGTLSGIPVNRPLGHGLVRTGSGIFYYLDGVVQLSSGTTTGTVPPNAFAVGAVINSLGSPASFLLQTCGFFCHGRSLDATQMSILDAAVKRYRQRIATVLEES